jgi:hypothetical protein
MFQTIRMMDMGLQHFVPGDVQVIGLSFKCIKDDYVPS